MREYRFQATDETLDALRLLRSAWTGMATTSHQVVVTLADRRRVRVFVEAADVEDTFEAFRLNAELHVEAEDVASAEQAPGDFAAGGNDIVLFTGAAWSEAGARLAADGLGGGAQAPGSTMHLSGHPGQLTETAEVVCLTTDAVVVAATSGQGLLLRTGLAPNTIDVVRDRERIAAFLLERGYGSA